MKYPKPIGTVCLLRNKKWKMENEKPETDSNEKSSKKWKMENEKPETDWNGKSGKKWYMENEKPETDLIFEFIDHQEENIGNQILNVENQNLNIEHQRENILEQEINIENLKSDLENHLDLENHNMAYEVDTDDQELYGTYAKPRFDYKMKKRIPRRYGYDRR